MKKILRQMCALCVLTIILSSFASCAVDISLSDDLGSEKVENDDVDKLLIDAGLRTIKQMVENINDNVYCNIVQEIGYMGFAADWTEVIEEFKHITVPKPKAVYEITVPDDIDRLLIGVHSGGDSYDYEGEYYELGDKKLNVLSDRLKWKMIDGMYSLIPSCLGWNYESIYRMFSIFSEEGSVFCEQFKEPRVYLYVFDNNLPPVWTIFYSIDNNGLVLYRTTWLTVDGNKLLLEEEVKSALSLDQLIPESKIRKIK